jgi:SAM-dependent methyltransferase
MPPMRPGATDMRRFWNARAREDPFYFVDTRSRYLERGNEQRFWEEADELVDYFLSGLGAQLRDTDTVLEIGCGVGRFTRVLARRAREVIALDVSDEMLARARELCADLEGVRWVLGDGVSLPGVDDGTVDACVSIVVFQHFPGPEIALGYVCELGRVLRERGWAALQVSNDPRVHAPPHRLRAALRSLLRRGPRGTLHPAWLGSHVELGELRAAASSAGLELEKVWGEGSQYCQVLLRKVGRGDPSPSTARDAISDPAAARPAPPRRHPGRSR